MAETSPTMRLSEQKWGGWGVVESETMMGFEPK